MPYVSKLPDDYEEVEYPVYYTNKQGWLVRIGPRSHLPGIFLTQRDAEKAASSYYSKYKAAKAKRKKNNAD